MIPGSLLEQQQLQLQQSAVSSRYEFSLVEFPPDVYLAVTAQSRLTLQVLPRWWSVMVAGGSDAEAFNLGELTTDVVHIDKG